MKITPLGDSALTVRLGAKFTAAPDNCLREVARLLHRLGGASLPGVVELAPAFTTVSVFYDPAEVVAVGAPLDQIFEWMTERIKAALSPGRAQGKGKSARSKEKVVEIPVCYVEEFAPDLRAVAESTGLAQSEIIRQHAGATYRVACVGFAPGFPFLTGLPAALATPRRAVPRTQVPAGAVAIGGAQTGIYPQQTPGGWNVIGRTPRRLFDVTRDPPALLAAGAAVRFRRITRSEFDSLSQ